MVVRVFNSADHAVTASLKPAFAFESAERCDLEESSRTSLPVARDGTTVLDARPRRDRKCPVPPVPHLIANPRGN